MKNLLLCFMLILSLSTYGQDVELEIVPENEPTIGGALICSVYLKNVSDKEISIIGIGFSFQKEIYKDEFIMTCNGVSAPYPNAKHTYTLCDRSFIKLKPGEKAKGGGRSFTTKIPGKYVITWQMEQSPELVVSKRIENAKTKKLLDAIHPFKATTTYEFEIKGINFAEANNIVKFDWTKVKNESSKNTAFWKSHSANSLDKAFVDPNATYQLSLNCQDIDSVSLSNIWKLKNLKVLRLLNYPYTELPQKIEELDLFYFHIESFHSDFYFRKEIFNIDSLRSLNVKGMNKINNFDHLSQLKKLEELILIDAKIGKLPDDIGNLQELKKVHFESLDITSLPESFSELKKMEELVLHNTKISELPDNIGNLQELKKVHFASLDITSLPESFSELKKINSFKISSTPLRSIKYLQSPLIKYLSLYNLELDAIPDEIDRIKNLWMFTINDCKVTSISPNIQNLKNLTILHLENIPLTELPVEIKNCPSLNTVVFQNCSQIIKLPVGFSEIEKLKSLTINKCPNFKKDKEYKKTKKALKSRNGILY